MPSVSYQQQLIRCGKRNCHCNTADKREWHGPYWYAYWRDESTGKTRSKYIGKKFNPPEGRPRTTYSDRSADASRRGSERADRQARERADRNARTARDARERQEREARQRQEQARQRARSPRGDEDDATCLGVSVNVTQDELKRAWRRKMQQHHPDRYPEAERARQEEIAKNLNSAYQRMRKRRGWQ